MAQATHWAAVIFYNDTPELLDLCLGSMKRNGFKIICVDGAYVDFVKTNRINGMSVDTYASTEENQNVAKKHADVFIPCPENGWETQIDKRNAALAAVPDGDFYWSLDADEEVIDNAGIQPITMADVYRIMEYEDAKGTTRKFSAIRTYRKAHHLKYIYQHCRIYDSSLHVPGNLDSGLIVKAHWDKNALHPFIYDNKGAIISIRHHRFLRPQERIKQKVRYYLDREEAKLSYA